MANTKIHNSGIKIGQSDGLEPESEQTSLYAKDDGSVYKKAYGGSEAELLTDEISVNDLSGTLSVSNGGTGTTTLTGFVQGNGTSAFTASSLDASDIPNLSANKITSDELDTARLPDGVLTLDDVALDGTLRSVKDKDGNTSVLKLSTGEVTIQGMTVGLGSGAITTNLAIGSNALSSNTSGTTNVALGANTLKNNTSGNNCVAIGEVALEDNTTGYHNIGIGYRAMQHTTTGYYNTAIGGGSLRDNTTGYRNITIGLFAGTSTSAGNPNETSTQCIYIGTFTKASADGVDSEIVIGSNATGNGSNTVTIVEKPIFPDMPTSSSGLPSGSLYSDGGTIKIV